MPLPRSTGGQISRVETPQMRDLRRVLQRFIPQFVTSIIPASDPRARNVLHLTIRGQQRDLERVVGEIPAKYRLINVVRGTNNFHAYYQAPERL